MANTLHMNTLYLDTAGAFSAGITAVKPIIKGIIFRSTAAASTFILRDTNAAGAIKIEIDGTDAYQDGTQFIDLQGFPIEFSGTLYVDTITNCHVILVGEWYTKTA